MNIKKITHYNGKLTFFAAINQIELNSDMDLTQILSIIRNLQVEFSLQFFNEKYVLNSEHIFNACYFVEKAFIQGKNISNKKNIELLLYLSTKRQIKRGIDDFGLNNENINNRILTYCILSNENRFTEINTVIKNKLCANDAGISLDDTSPEKLDQVKEYFDITENQLNIALRSYGQKPDQIIALNDLICEKMALLSVEKT